VTGDFNIRLDRDISHAEQLRSLFESFGLRIGISGPTHRDGGILDLVAACDDVPVSVATVERSDHSLLYWPAATDRPPAPSITVRSRPWRRLDIDEFRTKLAASELCQPSLWQDDADTSAAQYNDVITRILDQVIPARDIIRRPRPSDPWFDADCRAAKRLTRRLERVSRAASRRAAEIAAGPSAASSSAVAETARQQWLAQRRLYRQLRRQKSASFWSDKLKSATGPRDVWSTVDRLVVPVTVLALMNFPLFSPTRYSRFSRIPLAHRRQWFALLHKVFHLATFQNYYRKMSLPP